MEEILKELEASIQDHYLSRSEKKEFKTLLSQKHLDSHQLTLLRTKIYELADSTQRHKIIL